MQSAALQPASTLTSPVPAPPGTEATGLAGRLGQLAQERRSVRQASCGATLTQAADPTPATPGTTDIQVFSLATGRQQSVPSSPSGRLRTSQSEAVVPAGRTLRDRRGLKRRSRQSAAAKSASSAQGHVPLSGLHAAADTLAGEAGLPARDSRRARQCHGRTTSTSAAVALAAAMAGVEVGAVELAQERVHLAEQRGRAKHAGTGNAMVSSKDVASGSAQAERGISAGMLQQRAVVSEWRQPHPLERRPKVQRHLQQAASVRQSSSLSTAHATPQRQMATDVALQTHRTGPLATLDNHLALAALALFLEKGREPGDLICWEHIQQQKHLERQRAALQERLQHVVPDAQLAVHLEMKQPVLITQLRLGEMAQQCLMERHEGLVHAALQRFRMQKRVAIDDLKLAGLRGLEIGIDKWDPERGCLTTVACWYIRDHISKTYGRLQTAICLPATTLEQLSKLHRVKQVFNHRHSREPSEVELLRLTGFHPQTLSRLQSAAALWEVDLDASPEDGSASLVETLSAQGEGNATEYSTQAQAKRELARAVAALPLVQASAVQMLYGLNQYGPMRAKEIGRRLGISAYRLNKVLEEAMLTLRSNHDLQQLVGAF